MMAKILPAPQLNITVKDRAAMESQLDSAVNIAQGFASKKRLGILVTRHNAEQFTVEPSASVPFGLIHERQAW